MSIILRQPQPSIGWGCFHTYLYHFYLSLTPDPHSGVRAVKKNGVRTPKRHFRVRSASGACPTVQERGRWDRKTAKNLPKGTADGTLGISMLVTCKNLCTLRAFWGVFERNVRSFLHVTRTWGQFPIQSQADGRQ